MRQTGGTYAAYRELSEERKTTSAALRKSFIADSFAAYKRFMTRGLQPGESIDVFLTDLRKLSVLFVGTQEQGLICAFEASLPERVKQIFRVPCRNRKW